MDYKNFKDFIDRLETTDTLSLPYPPFDPEAMLIDPEVLTPYNIYTKTLFQYDAVIRKIP